MVDNNKIKHLEFIQNVIARMCSNSFLIKGWAITLVSALFALAAKDSNMHFVLVSYIVIPVFWALDGFFISRERQFRDLYNDVIKKTEDQIDFNMNTSVYNIGDRTWCAGILSKTLCPFYGVSLFTTVIVMFLIKYL
ncbi:hypothetical protein ETU08_11700 [Apibacter muscae]|uniref:hypothetical protein n=1 Tax=Apibacter muscae TaxID=2509004 RepID=UPI0011ABC619|nr:hypothetical protein [Apibacter muscae]TWP27660.1 hypothetical protein ETU08_11700 [Apibacter muscae]